MSKKMGRPMTPKNEAKSVPFAAYLSPQEAKGAGKAVASSGQDKSKWLRGAIENEVKGPPIWVKSKWKSEELDGQFISFRLRSPNQTIEGVGRIGARQNPRGEISVNIFVDEHPTPNEGILTRIWLHQDAVDKIELNVESEPIKFSLEG
jgi:hypothetical protein